MTSDDRKIIHIDMDAFFASVEQRDDPSLKGRPVIVGGDPSRRGVVAACSYEARTYGIHSAMPSKVAHRLCPHATFLEPRFDAYVTVSKQIRSIFKSYTDMVEPLSLDEAYLDVTTNKVNQPIATQIAHEIKLKILDATGLTASAGISYNKFVAKVASDENKPDGVCVIPPGKAQSYLDSLPVQRFFGVGKVTAEKMNKKDIFLGKDLRRYSKDQLIDWFGKMGGYYYLIARGIDHRKVNPNWVRKSYGKERTFNEDIDDMSTLESVIESLTNRVCEGLEKEHKKGKTLSIKVRYENFDTISKQLSLDSPTSSPQLLSEKAVFLLNQTEAGMRKVRLLGISVSNFGEKKVVRHRLSSQSPQLLLHPSFA
jgi:DNA polymerase IV